MKECNLKYVIIVLSVAHRLPNRIELNSDNLAQISLIRLPKDLEKGIRGPQGAAVSVRSVYTL